MSLGKYPTSINSMIVKGRGLKRDATKYIHRLRLLNGIVMVIKVDVPWPSTIASHEMLVSLGSFVLGVPGQHALQTHAYALYVLNW
jgi:hypothetical protein